MRYQKLSRIVLFSLILASLQFVRAGNSQEAFKSFPATVDSFPVIYEAEHGNYVDLTLQISTSASNGQFLRMGTTGSVTWDVNVDSSGWYNLKIRYQSPESDKVNDLIKNAVTWPMGFRWANYWIMD